MTKKNLQKIIKEETAKVLSEADSVAFQQQLNKKISTLDTLIRDVLRILRMQEERAQMDPNDLEVEKTLGGSSLYGD